MTTRARTFAAGAAIVAIVVAFCGTVQAAPTVSTIPNYNFQSYDVYYGNGGSAHFASLADGQMTPYLLPPVVPSGSEQWGYPSYWYPAVGDGGTNFHAWNPTSADFATAGGNGSLPGTAAGSQCYVNSATVWNNDVDIVTGTADETYGQAVATLAANKRYNFTVAVGSALGALAMDGQSLGFADVNTAALIQSHEDMYPNGWYKTGVNASNNMGGFQGWGGFGDISYSFSSSAVIGVAGVKAGDGLILIIGNGAGTAWSNVRLISQNWAPLYATGDFTWDNSSTTSWSSSSGGSGTVAWTGGKDAVFQGSGGTVLVTGTISSVNSLNFEPDWTAFAPSSANYPWVPAYALMGGTITLTGDATITVGSGTDNVNNAGGGSALIGSVLAGSSGLYKAGAGILMLSGANTYSGTTTVGGGTLMIGNGGTTGQLLNSTSIVNQANLAFSYSASASPTVTTYSGVISNTGSVDILGGGTTIFTGNNTYTGVTTVHAGSTLQVGNSTTTGALTSNVVNNGTLVFKRSNDVTFSNIIYDGSTFFPSVANANPYSKLYGGETAQHGNLTQAGAGRLTMDDSQMLYTGTTTVQSGALFVTNSSSIAHVLTNVSTTSHTGGVNVSGGFLVLDYSATPSNEASLANKVKTLLTTAYNSGSNSFQSGHDYQLYTTAATSFVGLGWVDNATTHQITVMPALYGDATLDGVVGPADLSKVLTNYGQTSMTWSQGDFTYDGLIGPADLSKLLTNYGKNGPLSIGNIPALAFNELTSDTQVMQMLAGAGVSITEAVPEPSSLVMLASLLAVAGVWGFRRHRRGR